MAEKIKKEKKKEDTKKQESPSFSFPSKEDLT